MLMRGDFDLNSAQRYTGSLDEVFKETILDQEFIFRKQVYELHRLYRVQKTLMQDLAGKEFERYNSWKLSLQTSPVPLINPTRHDPETIFSSIPLQAASSELLISQKMSEAQQSVYYKLQHRPLGLQLPSNQYISHGDDDPMELTLSLSLGEINRRKECTKRTWFDKKSHCSSTEVIDLEESTERISNCSQTVVIDLEESTERVSNGGAKHAPFLGCAAPIACFRGKQEPQGSLISYPNILRYVEKDTSHEIAESSSLVDNRKYCTEHNPFNQGSNLSSKINHCFEGLKECQDGIPCNNLPIKKQQIIPHQGGHLDLNKVLLDDTTCCLHSPSLAYTSAASSSDCFNGQVDRAKGGFSPTTVSSEEINNCLNKISDIEPQDDALDLALTNSNNMKQRTQILARYSRLDGITGGEANPTESVFRSSIDLCVDFGSPSSEPNNEKDEFTSKLQSGLFLLGSNYTCVATRQVSCEKSEVEDAAVLCSDHSQNALHDGCSDKSLASFKSHCISDDDSSSVKTMQSGTDICNSDIPAFDQSSRTHIVAPIMESSNGKYEYHDKIEESAEVDLMIRTAAESLIRISVYNAASHQDCLTKAASNEMETAEREQPRCPSDSYELIAFNLMESNEEDNCVSSQPFDVNDCEKKDFGVKLRRGRRLKDFQRDILPGLASLSRHEIREDMNILAGVLRSREYRKIRGKTAVEESWCITRRSRRSRLIYGRRNYS
ncbi:DUF863 domain-containing protein [Cephalotus follicularis]|uniref:DUF863 domain-containing protein n=1 Tax=Cephalotus follicularis TaxID=3775 RepID=A0A1Q3BHM9_CEPFO|nr:DUF863 domain-containing protein [Cephalotus follicularis]